jgi:hypothetical protein
VLLVVWAIGPLLYLTWRASQTGQVLVGADGPFAGDQLQYMSWIRDASAHLLAANLYDIGPARYVFLHPMFSLSSLVVRLGVSVPASYLLWKPAAVLALLIGVVAYARRTMDTPWARLGVVALALFYAFPAVYLLEVPALGSLSLIAQAANIGGELFLAGLLAGYLPSAISVGLMPLFFIGIERLLDSQRRHPRRAAAWYVSWTALAGLLVAWLHPWQGQVLLLVLVGILVLDRDRIRHLAAVAIPALATLAPLVYYFVLAQVDPSWHIARSQNQVASPSLIAAAIPLLPLAVPALFGLGGSNHNVQERIVRLWPLAVVAGLLLNAPFSQHLFEGVTLPLAVLAVRGARRGLNAVSAKAGGPFFGAALGVAGVVLLTVPGMANDASYLRSQVRSGNQPFLLSGDEQTAIDYLAKQPTPGGVLSPLYLGQAIPALTGRDTWVGHPSWSPDFSARADTAERLFAGDLTPADADQVVKTSGARFLLADCRGRADLSAAIAPRVAVVHRFGCATVYELHRS